MRLTVTRSSITSGDGIVLDAIQQEDPTLDLNFEETKTLTDDVSGNNLITFSRASSGTYVGSDGLIKTTPVNLVRRSEEFDNTSVWGVTTVGGGGTTPVVTANVGTAPDGTNTADRIQASAVATGSIDFSLVREKLIVDATPHTWSVYLKSNTGSNQQVTISYVTDAGGGEVVTVTPEWQRFSITKTQGNFECDIGVALDIANASDSSIDVLAWGAQLEEGSTATPYIKTTNTISGAPRFDHDPDTLESLGLLIEEARTNIIDRNTSNYTSIWSNAVPSGAYNNAGIAPDGTNTAFATTLYAPVGRGQKNYGIPADTNDYTFSIFIKSTGGQGQYVTYATGVNTGDQDTPNLVAYDFATDTVGHGYSRKLYANGWVRIWKTYTNSSLTLFLVSNNSSTSLDMLFWGAQLEIGSFPSSLIITPDGADVTRAADVAEITGADFAKTNLVPYSERFDQWEGNDNLTPNFGIAPDGTFTAARSQATNTEYQFTKTFNSVITSLVLLDANTKYTASIHVKDNGGGVFTMEIDDNQFAGSRYRTTFTFATETFSYTGSGSSRMEDASFVDVGNGWYRISQTFTTDSTAGAGVFMIRYGTQDNLVWGAQLEEGDVLTEYTPSVESFVSRASSATYVDDTTGLIKTTPVNLLTYSNNIGPGKDFFSTNATIVTENADTAPDGTTTATRISSDVGYAFLQLNLTSGVDYVFSFYAKTSTDTSWTINTQSTPFIDKTVTVVPGEWARVDLAFTATATGNQQVRFVKGGGLTGDILVWGAQVEEGTTPTTLIPTSGTISGAARYENGELILEEARTNIIDRNTSNYNSIWSTNTPIGAYNNAGIAPDGTNTAFATTSYDGILRGQKNYNISITGEDYTFSIFIKSPSGQGQFISYNTGWNSGDRDTVGNLIYDFSTDTVGHGYSRKLYANGWVRISKTYRQTTNSTFVVSINAVNSTDFLYWGAQLEQGSYPTSLIITPDNANVTRAADVSTSALGVDSFYNQSEGTVFIETSGYPHPITGKALVPFAFSDNSYNNRVILAGSTGTTQFNFDVVEGGLPARAILGNYSTSGLKAAGGYKATGSAGSLDGASVVTSNTPNIPTTIDRLDIGNAHDGSQAINGHIKRLAYFNTRLPDAKLEELTLLTLTPTLDLDFATTLSLTDSVNSNNLIDFTRASSGTYVGSDGLIKTTPVNLLTYSQEFNQTNWVNRRTTDAITAETLDPLAGSTATKLVDSTDSNTHRLDKIGLSLSGNTTYTFSCWLKAAEYSHATLTIAATSNLSDRVVFDLSTGVVSSASSGYTGSIESFSNNWYRCKATKTLPSSVTIQQVLIGLAQDSTTVSFAGTGTSGIYIWGAQLEEGTTATDYIPTTSTISGAPRFDHDPATLESLGLLIEEARTNFLVNSEGSSAAFGSGIGTNVSDTVENILTPRGTVGGVRKVTPLDNTTVKVWRMGDTTSGTANTTYSASIWVKTVDGGSTNFILDVNDSGVTTYTATGEWQRFSVTGTKNAIFRFMDVQLNADTDALYLWGSQIEEGSFPTSYIPTEASTVTRAADVAEITGTNFNGFYNQSEGTVFVESEAMSLRNTVAASFSDGSINNRMEVRSVGSNVNNSRTTIINAGVTQSNAETLAAGNDYRKIALRYATNDTITATDGTLSSQDTTVTVPTITQLYLGNNLFLTTQRPGHIKRLTYFPLRAANSQLEGITS